MKIRYVSDLHLEGFTGLAPEKLVERFIPGIEEEVLVLAGDISSRPHQLVEFLKYVSKFFEKVIFIPGNHEYYKNEYNTWNTEVAKALEPIENLHTAFDEVRAIEHGGVTFIYGTMWADGGKSFKEECDVGLCLNDFHLIKYGDKFFSVPIMKEINREQVAQIIDILSGYSYEHDVVVITHHLPSYEICHPRFGTDINGGFACSLDDILHSELAPSYWIHGHTHDTIDMQIGFTRVLSNPAGYRQETGGSDYNKFGKKYIEFV